MKTMDALKAGEKGIVRELRLKQDESAALIRLGLVPGTELRCLRRSPLGDPAAYLLRGVVLAVRKRDAARILISED